MPGMDRPVCVARLGGAEADTLLILNNDHAPIVVLGHADWSGLAGNGDAAVSIDGSDAVHLTAMMVQNLVLIRPEPPLVARLRTARALEWTLPFGHFRTEVAGLGAALDAVVSCASAAADGPTT